MRVIFVKACQLAGYKGIIFSNSDFDFRQHIAHGCRDRRRFARDFSRGEKSRIFNCPDRERSVALTGGVVVQDGNIKREAATDCQHGFVVDSGVVDIGGSGAGQIGEIYAYLELCKRVCAT